MAEQHESWIDKNGHWLIFLFVCLFVIGAWFLTRNSLIGLQDRGTYGDMFGGINALFSGLAFAGLIIAILLQRKELSLQRQELTDTRKVLSEQREQLENQSVALQQQNFESTFFQMLKLLNDIVASMRITTRKGTVTHEGRDCFQHYIERLKDLAEKAFTQSGFARNDQVYFDKYNNIYNSARGQLTPYFKNLDSIISFVYQSRLPAEQKLFYINLIKIQLSDFELSHLLYAVLSLDLFESMNLKSYISEYDLLSSIPDEILIKPQHRNLLK